MADEVLIRLKLTASTLIVSRQSIFLPEEIS